MRKFMLFLFIITSIQSNASEWPWRVVDGVTNNCLLANGWADFYGINLQKSEGGKYRIRGSVKIDRKWVKVDNAILKNYPWSLADDDTIGSFKSPIRIKYIGLESYTSVLGSTITVRVFDHGQICGMPWEVKKAQAVANKEATEKARERSQKVEDAKLKADITYAEKGYAFGQYRLGIRYLKGDGVELDENKAVSLLKMSAEQGHSKAKETLKNLSK